MAKNRILLAVFGIIGIFVVVLAILLLQQQIKPETPTTPETQPGIAKPITEPEPVVPVTTEPDVTEPTVPVVTEPKAPEVTEPAEPEATGPEVTPEGEYIVHILRNTYDPETINVPVGATVTWVNEGNSAYQIHHIAVTRLFTSDRILPGDTFSFTFDESGSYRYGDTIRSYLDGYVNVGQSNSITGQAISNFTKVNAFPLFLLSFLAMVLSVCYIMHKA
ncbi:MAG: hypothetical protein KJ601_00360 [Nanoarchaeota archaeon]|nr:hypothetical protein [Nanoarchaeota archaeon]